MQNRYNSDIKLNENQKRALKQFKSYDLTEEMLLKMTNSDMFERSQFDALQNLLEVRRFPVDLALAEIEGLDGRQADGIVWGLSRADVLPLSEDFHMMALAKLKSHGLTPDMLLKRKDGGYEIGRDHACALVALVENRGFTISQALAEIQGLNSDQAFAVGRDLSREDVIKLTNYWHIHALQELKKHGLSTEMLLNRKEGDHEFGAGHSDALVNLIKERGFTANQALAEIEGLSSDQAKGFHCGLIREDVIKLSNFSQVLALAELKKYGLTAEMLLNRKDGGYKFDDQHSRALHELIVNHHHSVQQALAAIEERDGYDAAFIATTNGKFEQALRMEVFKEGNLDIKHSKDYKNLKELRRDFDRTINKYEAKIDGDKTELIGGCFGEMHKFFKTANGSCKHGKKVEIRYINENRKVGLH